MNRIGKVRSITIRPIKDRPSIRLIMIIGQTHHQYRSNSMPRMLLGTAKGESRRDKAIREQIDKNNQRWRISTVIVRVTKIITMTSIIISLAWLSIAIQRNMRVIIPRCIQKGISTISSRENMIFRRRSTKDTEHQRTVIEAIFTLCLLQLNQILGNSLPRTFSRSTRLLTSQNLIRL